MTTATEREVRFRPPVIIPARPRFIQKKTRLLVNLAVIGLASSITVMIIASLNPGYWLAPKLAMPAFGPPWDVPADALKTLPPDSYTGPIEPGVHAAEILAHARHVPPLVRFNDADRKRAWALHDFAVSEHDAALARLLAALDDAGRRDDTAIIVASDTGMDVGAHVPFGDAEPLDDGSLTSLLVVHSAGQANASHVRVPTSAVDIATTVLAELGLSPPASFEGEDLFDAEADDGTRPLYASSGEHQLVSWMGLLLRTNATQSDLCIPALDAACGTDASPLAPLASEALRRITSEAAKAKRATHSPPTLDAKTAAALTAWGR